MSADRQLDHSAHGGVVLTCRDAREGIDYSRKAVRGHGLRALPAVADGRVDHDFG